MITEWNIQSRSRHCGACGKAFADQEPYHTLLLDQRSDMLRMDVCNACWQQQYSEGATERKGFVSYWQGVYEAPPPPVDPIQKETAETLLRKILELKNPQFGPAAYILAVMLERKRLLKVKEQLVQDGSRFFVYEHPKSGDVFTIRDPNLQLNQLEVVQRDVAHLLKHGLEATLEGLSPAPAVAAEAGEPAEPTTAAPAEPEANHPNESKPEPA